MKITLKDLATAVPVRTVPLDSLEADARAGKIGTYEDACILVLSLVLELKDQDLARRTGDH